MICLFRKDFCSLEDSFENNWLSRSQRCERGLVEEDIRDSLPKEAIEDDRRGYRISYRHVLLPLCRCSPDSIHHWEPPAYRKAHRDDCRDVSMYSGIAACLSSQLTGSADIRLQALTGSAHRRCHRRLSVGVPKASRRFRSSCPLQRIL